MPYALNHVDFQALQRRNPGGAPILAEGDSWLAYPNLTLFSSGDTNLVHHLAQRDDLNILSRATNGDELLAMLSGSSKEELIRLMRTGEFRCLLFSGGGNDIVGAWDMDFLLVADASVGYIHPTRWGLRLKQMELAYRYLCELVNLHGKSRDRAVFKLITHPYDLAIPSNVAPKFLGFKVTDTWMNPYLEALGITSPQEKTAVAHRLLGDFAHMLNQVAADYVGVMEVVATQGTLQPHEWANEIHPTSEGFAKLAARIEPALRYT